MVVGTSMVFLVLAVGVVVVVGALICVDFLFKSQNFTWQARVTVVTQPIVVF